MDPIGLAIPGEGPGPIREGPGVIIYRCHYGEAFVNVSRNKAGPHPKAGASRQLRLCPEQAPTIN